MRDERHHSVIVDYLAPAIERVARLLSLSHSPFAYFAYIFYFSPSIFTPKVILVLCDHRVRIFTAFRCGCIPITTHFGFSLPLPADAKMAADDQSRSLPKWFGEHASCVPPVYLNYVMARTRSVRRVVVMYVLLILFVLNAKAGQLIFANYICGINILCIPSVFPRKTERRVSPRVNPPVLMPPPNGLTPPPPPVMMLLA